MMASQNSTAQIINTDYEVQTLERPLKNKKSRISVRYNLRFLFIGLLMGITLTKTEVISWFRIQEMFRFESFHMYGVMGSALVVGIVSIFLIKKFKIKSLDGEDIFLPSRTFQKGQVYGGLLFGLGWAMTGACPGPLFAQIGAGTTVVIITLLSAIAGTWVYGLIREKLPH
jgi:uncharacterized membrane protein YedE/YeeE